MEYFHVIFAEDKNSNYDKNLEIIKDFNWQSSAYTLLKRIYSLAQFCFSNKKPFHSTPRGA